MSITVTCACGRQYHLPHGDAGRKAKCGTCGRMFLVPAPATGALGSPSADHAAPPTVHQTCDVCRSASGPIAGAKDFVIRRKLSEASTLEWNVVATIYALVHRSTIRICRPCVEAYVRKVHKGCAVVFCGFMWSVAALIFALAVVAGAAGRGYDLLGFAAVGLVFGGLGLWFLLRPLKLNDPEALALNHHGHRIMRDRHLAEIERTEWPPDLSVVSGQEWDRLVQEQTARLTRRT